MSTKWMRNVLAGLVAAGVGVPLGVASAVLTGGSHGSTNPDLPGACGLEVTLVLDESYSIASPVDFSSSVETAVNTLVGGLVNTGSSVRIVEFDGDGRHVTLHGTTGFQPVLALDGPDNDVLEYIARYLDGSAGAADGERYDPAQIGKSATNWEAAFYRASALDATGPGPGQLVVFVTDGVPNTVGQTSGTNVTGGNNVFSKQAWEAAVDEVGSIQSSAHIVGLGVGAAGAVTAGGQTAEDVNLGSIARLIERNAPEIDLFDPAGAVADPVVNDYTGNGANESVAFAQQDPLDIKTVDAINVGAFEGLATALHGVALELCNTTATLEKVAVDALGNPLPDGTPWGPFTVTLDGAAPRAVDATVPAAVWENLSPGEHTVAELVDAADWPIGWQPGPMECFSGGPRGAGVPVQDMVADDGPAVTFTLPGVPDGVDLWCYVTNVAPAPTLTVVKTTSGGFGTFRFVAVEDDESAATPVIPDVTTDADHNPQSSAPVALIPGVTYTVSEADLPTVGWTPGELVCTVDGTDGPATSTFVAPATGNVTCAVTNTYTPPPPDPVYDVGIVKSDNTGDGVVDSDDVFTYSLVVTNHGDSVVTGVTVIDDVPATLQVLAVRVPATWTSTPSAASPNHIEATTGSLQPGESATIEVDVRLVSPSVDGGFLPDGGGPVVAAPPSAPIVNTACVAIAEPEPNTSDNCDDDTVTPRSIAAVVWVECRGDAPLLHYQVATSDTLDGEPITLRWTPDAPDADPAEVVVDGLADGAAGALPWPGAQFVGDVPVDWPGWRPIRESDYVDGSLAHIDPEHLSNGMILDATLPDFPWRGPTTVTLSVNPEVTFHVAYPDTSTACVTDRSTALTIDKVASGSTFAAGQSFTYDLAVVNVSAIGAASPVTLSDVIPSNLKVETITTAGTTFPRWTGCGIDGADVRGYGGTLTCTLFGPLMPGAAAPVVKVRVAIDPNSATASITNIGVVKWALADDPSDTGEASDPATVDLAAQLSPPTTVAPPPPRPLPRTGSALAPQLVPLALGFVGLGLVAVLASRRRRQATQGR